MVRFMPALVRFVLLIAWLLAASSAGAAAGAMVLPPPPEQAAGKRVDMAAFAGLVEDPHGTLSVDAVRERFAAGHFMPAAASGVNLGYTRSAWWVGFRLPAHPDGLAPQPRVLEIGFPTLDRIDYFAPGASVARVVGDHYPFADRALRHRHFAFDVPAGQADSGLVVLRV